MRRSAELCLLRLRRQGRRQRSSMLSSRGSWAHSSRGARVGTSSKARRLHSSMEERGKDRKTERRTLPAQTAAPGSAPAVKHAQQQRQLSTLEPRCQGRHQQQSKEVTLVDGRKGKRSEKRLTSTTLTLTHEHLSGWQRCLHLQRKCSGTQGL